MTEYQKLYYEIHKEEYHERYMKNRDKILARNRERKEEKREYDKKRNCTIDKSEYNKAYYEAHKKEIRAYYKAYRERQRNERLGREQQDNLCDFGSKQSHG